MNFKVGAPEGTYSAYILPFSGNNLPERYLGRYPELKDFPLPEKEKSAATLAGGQRVLTVCMDENGHEKRTADTFRKAFSDHKKFLSDTPVIDLSECGAHTEPAMRGLALSDYKIGTFKEAERMDTDPGETTVYYLGGSPETAEEASVRADVQMRIMHLVDLPAADKTPEMLGDFAAESARRFGYQCEVWDKSKLEHLGMHAINAVGRGSDRPPVLIISRYRGKPEDKTVHAAVLGKGVTFDTGGISIKPSENLHYMKCDMAGGAAALGAVEVAARLKLRVNLTVVVPAAENAVDARSFLPGDVIHSYSGKTIEILNTDAEGRLILADALAWTVKHEKPATIVDLATLTGSAVRALGKEAAALYSDDLKLRDALMKAGEHTGDKLWPMPLSSDYDHHLHSDIADVSNLSQNPTAGSVAAAKFLQVFTDKHPSWAHIDMAGPSFTDSPFAKMKSASGYGVQLLFEFLRKTAAN